MRILISSILLLVTSVFYLPLQAQETEKSSEAKAAETTKADTSTDTSATEVDTKRGERPEIEANYVQSEAEAEALGPKNKTFMEKFYEFRDVNKKLTALKTEYPAAKPARQEEIDKEYWPLYEDGKKAYDQLFGLAFEAFNESVNRNPFVNNILYGTIEWEYRQENYEKAHSIFKKLVPHGISKEASVIYVFAGLSAMMVMELDDCEAWMNEAADNGYLIKYMNELSKTEKGHMQSMALEQMYTKIPVFRKDWPKEHEIRKAETEAGEQDPAKKLPRVLLKTNKGDIVLELFENEAPNTVANFISLVEKGFYNKTVFHRVLPQFMAQGGDPTGTGMGGPGYAIDDECRQPNARKHFRGSISMANAGPNTNGSQFFLTFVPTYSLDGRHTVFGRVVEGIETLARIQRVDPGDKESIIPELDKIEEAKVLNKRDHAYEPVKNNNR